MYGKCSRIIASYYFLLEDIAIDACSSFCYISAIPIFPYFACMV